jgi:hypothetical protein
MGSCEMEGMLRMALDKFDWVLHENFSGMSKSFVNATWRI